MYEVDITSEGRRHRNRLPEKIRDAVLALALGALAEEPRRVGKPLAGELEGLWSARRSEYRIIYEINDHSTTVLIHRIQHRRDVYRPRQEHRVAPIRAHWPEVSRRHHVRHEGGWKFHLAGERTLSITKPDGSHQTHPPPLARAE